VLNVYVVQRGDTLFRISVRFGVPLADLVAANNIRNARLIWVGQRLTIPGTANVSPTGTPVPASPADANSVPVTVNPGGQIVVSARAREIYQKGLTLGNDPHAFAKVGDCNSTTPHFLAAFDAPADYRLGTQYAYLQETITQFAASFARESQAVHIGYTAYDLGQPEWANPNFCSAGETPLQCEYRLQRPSIAIVALGTNDYGHPAALFESSLRTILDESIARGVLPILVTKADNVEGGHRINATIRSLAAEYQLPLVDFWAAAQNLPDGGLLADGYHLTGWASAYFDSPGMMQYGWTVRNLLVLQGLDAVWRAVR
jgi:hypothetical protein